MKYILSILLFALVLTSCNKKTVLLPETTNTDITEILDVSPVYLFYDETQPDGTEFNRKNMISTTNWLVNIDKRLTLKQILPHLQYLQDKRHGDGMHTNKNARNYFTCSNTDLKNLSFIEFTDVVYESDFTNKITPDFSSITYFSLVKFNSQKLIEMETVSEGHGVIESYDFIGLLNEIDGLTKSGKLNIKLSFNSNLSFQDYISIKSEILKVNFDSLKILNSEIIYN